VPKVSLNFIVYTNNILNQPFTNQDLNNLVTSSIGYIKPPKVPEISVEKMSIHSTQKLPFLLRVKKRECSFVINSLCSATPII